MFLRAGNRLLNVYNITHAEFREKVAAEKTKFGYSLSYMSSEPEDVEHVPHLRVFFNVSDSEGYQVYRDFFGDEALKVWEQLSAYADEFEQAQAEA